MTAQIHDLVGYGDEMYQLVGVNGTGLFEPGDHGLEPVALHTACWRGFICTYVIADQQLLLHGLRIGFKQQSSGGLVDNAPTLFDVRPAFDQHEHIARYEGLDAPVAFTGSLLLACEFLRDLYVHMGFHPAWKYERTLEVIFDSGAAQAVHDRSAQMARVRAEVLSGARPSPDGSWEHDGADWISRTFQLDYGRSFG
ncbi:MAG: hypothetical protein ACT4OX_15050 [Actinomycetota bacterium]